MDQDPPIQSPVFLIETDKIKPNPQQPRREFNEEQLKELAGSIREFGILQPLVVTKVEQVTETGTDVEYQLIAGERRWRASKIAGLERLPAVIRSVELDKEKLELAIIENIQRVNLNPIEQARAYAKLQDQFSLTQREVATRLGKSRESVANTIRLLSLPQQIQDAVSTGNLSESQGRLLLTVENISQQQSLFEQIMNERLSVREAKSRMQRMRAAKDSAPPAPSQSSQPDPEAISVQRELEEALGAPVKVVRAGEEGRITISFNSSEELHGILGRFVTSQNEAPVAEPYEQGVQDTPNQVEPPKDEEEGAPPTFSPSL